MSILLAISLGSRIAGAEAVYEYEPILDSAILASTLVISAAERSVLSRHTPVAPACLMTSSGLCDPSELPSWDAAVVGQWNEDWARITDVALVGAFTMPTLLLGTDHLLSEDSRWQNWLVDSAIVLESVLVSNVAIVTSKYAIRRPRPTQYTDAAPAETFGVLEHQLSFPSGHTAAVSAAFSATAMTWGLRHPDPVHRWVGAGGSVALTTLTAYGRVRAGKHFPSDVIAGAILGTSFGVLVPWLHRSETNLVARVSLTDDGSIWNLSSQF